MFLLVPADGRLSPFDGKPVITELPAMFFATIKLAVHGGYVFALPFLTAGMLWVLKDLMPRRFWRFTTFFVISSYAFFLIGLAFVYYVSLPTLTGFFLSWNSDVAEPVVTIASYMEMALELGLLVGLVYELPLVMFILSKWRVVSYQRWKSLWLYSIPSSIVLAAILTPSIDGLNMFMVAAPLAVLYQVGVGAAWIARPQDGNWLGLTPALPFIIPVLSGVEWVLAKIADLAGYVIQRAVRAIALVSKGIWRGVKARKSKEKPGE